MNKLKILYPEDSAHDAKIVGRTLKNADIDFSIKLVDSQNMKLRLRSIRLTKRRKVEFFI